VGCVLFVEDGGEVVRSGCSFSRSVVAEGAAGEQRQAGPFVLDDDGLDDFLLIAVRY